MMTEEEEVAFITNVTSADFDCNRRYIAMLDGDRDEWGIFDRRLGRPLSSAEVAALPPGAMTVPFLLN